MSSRARDCDDDEWLICPHGHHNIVGDINSHDYLIY